MLTGPRRLKVNSRRNSACVVPLDRLDWSRWFTDRTDQRVYLHVWRLDEPDCIMRVYCKREGGVRLAMRGGELYWLVDALKK